MTICFVEWPCYALVQLLYVLPCGLCYMPHDAVHHLALAEPLLTGCYVLWINPPLTEIDISLFLVHTQHHDWFLPTNLKQQNDMHQLARAYNLLEFENFIFIFISNLLQNCTI